VLDVTTNPTTDFSSDRPLADGRKDRLNRTPFAERIADVLLGLPKGNSLTSGNSWSVRIVAMP
jgi:hypothetical protein